MAKEKIKESAKDVVKKKSKQKFLKVLLLFLILFLINIYIILGIIYKKQNFTISLDSENGKESNLTIYEELDKKLERTYLKCKDIDFFTDISVNWLPENIHNEGEGSHNGENYIAYTFYAENQGQETINYWTRIDIDDVIKNVDEAIRVMIYKNDEPRVIYAKPSRATGEPEKGTIPFKSDTNVMLEQTKNFKVGDLDKYTVVIWIEGDDPECKNDLIGGEIKMHMTITEEHIPQKELNRTENDEQEE